MCIPNHSVKCIHRWSHSKKSLKDNLFCSSCWTFKVGSKRKELLHSPHKMMHKKRIKSAVGRDYSVTEQNLTFLSTNVIHPAKMVLKQWWPATWGDVAMVSATVFFRSEEYSKPTWAQGLCLYSRKRKWFTQEVGTHVPFHHLSSTIFSEFLSLVLKSVLIFITSV